MRPGTEGFAWRVRGRSDPPTPRANHGQRYEIPAFAPHLKKFLEPERGSVLQREGEPRRFFYHFANPLLQPYVILNGLSEGLIDDDLLLSLRPAHEETTSEPPRLF
jgi:hypothetical protein